MNETTLNSGTAIVRRCGNCKLCCKVHSIAELEKPAGVWCKHCPGKGCSIYATRPTECRDYKCLWLDGVLPDECRPDTLHVVFAPEQKGDLTVVKAFESYWGAAEGPIADRAVLAFQNLGFGVEVVINGFCRKILIPTCSSASEEDAKDYFRRFFRASGYEGLENRLVPIGSGQWADRATSPASGKEGDL